ncbi:MAG: hypothetical protein WA463_11025 [Terriglobales bacterium]
MKAAPPSLDRIITLDNVSQLLHFFVAMFLVEHLSRWLGHSHWIWFGWVVALAAFKESVIDPHYESPEVAGNGWKDFSSFLVGATIGVLLK